MSDYVNSVGHFTRKAVRLNAERLAATEEATAKALKEEHLEGFSAAIMSLHTPACKDKDFNKVARYLLKEYDRLKRELADD